MANVDHFTETTSLGTSDLYASVLMQGGLPGLVKYFAIGLRILTTSSKASGSSLNAAFWYPKVPTATATDLLQIVLSLARLPVNTLLCLTVSDPVKARERRDSETEARMWDLPKSLSKCLDLHGQM